LGKIFLKIFKKNLIYVELIIISLLKGNN
jgi:hypothetical protein